jgi:ribosomal protein S27E
MSLKLRCPECEAVLRLAERPETKHAVRCPKCGAAVALPKQPGGPSAATRAQRQTPSEHDRDQRSSERVSPEPDRPDEGDSRVRRKKGTDRNNQPEAAKAPPWFPYLLIGMLVGVVVLVAILRLALGPDGFPKPAGGQSPAAKNVALVVCLVVGLLLMLTGTDGVKKRHIFGVENANYVGDNVSEWRGGKAVAVGIGQCAAGTILVGVALYGLVF